jgi:hypothetical protein
MATSEFKKLAQNYLRDQAAIIKKHGHTPKMSGQKFRSAMNDTKKTFENLKAAYSKPTPVA